MRREGGGRREDTRAHATQFMGTSTDRISSQKKKLRRGSSSAEAPRLAYGPMTVGSERETLLLPPW